jgi:hypothetical protein
MVGSKREIQGNDLSSEPFVFFVFFCASLNGLGFLRQEALFDTVLLE